MHVKTRVDVWSCREWNKKKCLFAITPTPPQPPPKPERRKSSQLLPANPEAGTLSNAALPSIHQHWLPRRWWWRQGWCQHQLLSEGWSKQRKSPWRWPGWGFARKQPGPPHPRTARCLYQQEGWGPAELGPLLSQVLARPIHFRLRERKEEEDGNARTRQATRAKAAFTFVRPSGGTPRPAPAVPRALRAAGSRASLGLLLPLLCRLLLKEDSAQPNSWLSQHRAQAT